jgi:plasmid stabilization system protein ParE
MKVQFSAAALADLEAIIEHIKMQNPARAHSFADEIVGRCQDLADMPKAYPLVPRFKRRGIRRRAYRDYLIFYRVLADRISIIRVLHGARDYDELLASEP